MVFTVTCGSLSASDSPLEIVISSTHAKVYRQYVDSIAYQSAGIHTIAKISLSDGTSWNLVVDPSNEYLLADLEKNLSVGTEVFLDATSNVSAYNLYTRKQNGRWISYNVGMSQETKQLLPKIVNIEKIVVTTKSNPNAVYYLYLSDGTKWRIVPKYDFFFITDTEDRLENWKGDDSLIVTRLFPYSDDETWFIINVDALNDQLWSEYASIELIMDFWTMPPGIIL